MKKIKVSICTGTACFVMGASDLILIGEKLPEDLKDKVEIEGITCMGSCKNAKSGKAPFVKVNGELISEANVASVIEKIREAVNSVK
jgi:NADH:ubiquinone oxidoreductase subunit E